MRTFIINEVNIYDDPIQTIYQWKEQKLRKVTIPRSLGYVGKNPSNGESNFRNSESHLLLNALLFTCIIDRNVIIFIFVAPSCEFLV